MKLSLVSPEIFFRQQLNKYHPASSREDLMVQTYLVDLLCQYLATDKLFTNQENFYFFEQWIKTLSDPQELKTMGDKLLLLSGFFPGHLQGRLVSVDYYQAQGQKAYGQMYSLTQNQVFSSLAGGFLKYVQLLDKLRQESEMSPLVQGQYLFFIPVTQ